MTIVADEAKRLSLDIKVSSHKSAPEKWWFFEVLGFKIYCYNFEWRRNAIDHHDLHHIVTGYPCTLEGEVQVAAWEFAAGRYPNIFSNLFCLPLITVGIFTMPRKLWAAFKYGMQSQSLYNTPITEELLNSKLTEIRARIMKPAHSQSKKHAALAFIALVSLALLPLIVIILLVTFLYT